MREYIMVSVGMATSPDNVRLRPIRDLRVSGEDRSREQRLPDRAAPRMMIGLSSPSVATVIFVFLPVRRRGTLAP